MVAAQNPLTSLADDAAFTRRAIDMQAGSVVLVGHSWAGTVITEAGDDARVKALLYVAAFAPSPGETTAELGKDYPAPPGLANPIVEALAFLTLSPETIADHFAQDVSPEQANLIAITQGPVRGANFEEAVSVAAWQTKPSWYIVAEQDHMIDPGLERDLAKKIDAHVTSLPTSHVPMISRRKDVIQELLAESGAEGVRREPVSVEARGLEAAADWNNLKSLENYIGYGRSQNFASPGGARGGEPRFYQSPAELRLNEWALSGDWTVRADAAVLNEPNGRIAYRFHARDLHLVMGPSRPGTSVKFRVLIDGRLPGAAHGTDVDAQGDGTVIEQRLYRLIRLPGPIVDRQFEIEFFGSGVEAYAFTFG